MATGCFLPEVDNQAQVRKYFLEHLSMSSAVLFQSPPPVNDPPIKNFIFVLKLIVIS